MLAPFSTIILPDELIFVAVVEYAVFESGATKDPPLPKIKVDPFSRFNPYCEADVIESVPLIVKEPPELMR